MEKLNELKQDWIYNFNNPLIISGPCSAETEEQIMNTAIEMDTSYIQVFRAGIWKPRTKPSDFEGIGEIGLSWLNKVKEKTGMLIAIEIANAEHIRLAKKYNIDILWIGARSTVNPFTVQEIANSLEGTDKIILVKNPVNPDIDLWIGALERLIKKNIKKIGVIHRGFSIYKNYKYRNQPNWKMALDFKKKYPNIPIFCDPSHICGNRKGIFNIAKKSLDFGYNGLIVETHYDPDHAWTDSKQQITPLNFLKIIKSIISEEKTNYIPDIDFIRTKIDEVDENILSMLSERMLLSKEIGKLKKIHNLNILQTNRFKEILNYYKNSGYNLGLSDIFLEKLFNIIHKESLNMQNINYKN